MADSVYEGMFILDAGRYGRDPEAVAGPIPEMIQEAGGEILVSRLWEERRLAYPIKGYRKGAYWLTYFRLDGAKLAGIHRKCQLSSTILRVLFVKVDPRIVDTLVEHAQAGQIVSRREDTARQSARKDKEHHKQTAAEAGETATATAGDEAGDQLPSAADEA